MKHLSIQDQLIFHEGKKFRVYKCPAGFMTVGVGRNLETNGFSDDEIMLMLKNDIEACIFDLSEIFSREGFNHFSKGRKWALIDLRFNLGPGGFRGFRLMIAAIKGADWCRAGQELKDSLWWSQVQDARRETLFNQIITGEV